jgi:hypothetical protein
MELGFYQHVVDAGLGDFGNLELRAYRVAARGSPALCLAPEDGFNSGHPGSHFAQTPQGC